MHMASTSKKDRATSVGKGDQAASKRSPKAPSAPKQNKPKGSMGLGLLLIAIGTSLVGLGGLGYLFYQELLGSARREVDRSAEAQTRQIEGRLTNVQQVVDGVASGAKILSQQQPKPRGSEPYQRLVIEGLESSKPIAGMGITTNGNLLFPVPKPIAPYIWKEQSGLKPANAGQKLAAPYDKLLASDRPDIQKAPFYQGTLKGQASWSQPYSASGKNIITYSAPISDGQKVIGIVNADAISDSLLSLAPATPVPASEIKVGFVVIDASGKIISAAEAYQSPNSESLTSLAQQAKAQPTGITQTGGNLWAYRKIAGSDWLVAAYMPEAEITNKLLILVGGAAVGISAILAIAVLGFVNSLKKRLQPLTEECDRFLTQQGNAGVNAAGKDEIEHLGLSLKSTFQQVKTNEIRLRNELSQTSASDNTSTAAQIQQNFAESELMEAEVGDLLDVVSSMEEGDLTVEAQVNDRATGLVADTLNRLREKLVEIISSVLGTAQQVAQGASDLEALAQTVVQNTAEQAQSVAQGQALTEQVAAIAQRSAAQVNVANQSLQEVRDTVASGQTSINTLTDSITVLQTGSAQIVQRMKTLGEFVGLAEQFVQDQGQIASLTQVLALNATLVAARAAEQKDPQQFASVAREFESIAGQVNDLATQTNDGLTVLQQRTSQIQTVVTAIDAEVQNLSGLVSGFTSGVEASQSAFNSIQTATEEVVQIGQTITESSTEIADAAGSTASYISEIAQLADRTADLTRSARQQAEAMGNQAQQLLQGIQFFRLPSGVASPARVAPESFVDHTTSVNNFVDTTASNSNGINNLGVAVPAIAVAAAATAVAFSQQPTPDSTVPNEEVDNTALDNRYLENLIDEGINRDQTQPDLMAANGAEFSEEQNFIAAPENFITQNVAASQNHPSTMYSDLTDISLIEESLLADLKQEVYDESSLEDNAYSDETTFKNPMEGVNESDIDAVSSDPLIVSATSSFLENTTFNTVASPLSEDDINANLPTSVDFSIPDLDDDFHIPNINIESALDDSHSFFDAESLEPSESNQITSEFDPFYSEQAVESPDNSYTDDVFAANTIDEFSSENFGDSLSEDSISHAFDDYSNYGSNETINESLDDSLEHPSNEAFTDTFNTSFDESPFDRAFDEAISLDQGLAQGLDQVIQEDEFSSQNVDELYAMDQPEDFLADNLETQEELVDLPVQIPDIYLEDSLDDSFSEDFSFEPEENILTDSSEDLVEADNFFESNPAQESEELIDIANPFDIPAYIQDDEQEYAIASEFASYADDFDTPIDLPDPNAFIPELDSESQFPELSTDLDDGQEFSFDLDNNLSDLDVSTSLQYDEQEYAIATESNIQASSILPESNEEVDADISALFNVSDTEQSQFPELPTDLTDLTDDEQEFSFDLDDLSISDSGLSDVTEDSETDDNFFSSSFVPESEELVDLGNQLDISTSIQYDEQEYAIATEPNLQESSILPEADEDVDADISALFNVSEADELDNALDNQLEQVDAVDSAWISEGLDSGMSELSDTFEQLSDPFENLQTQDDDESFADAFANSMDLQDESVDLQDEDAFTPDLQDEDAFTPEIAIALETATQEALAETPILDNLSEAESNTSFPSLFDQDAGFDQDAEFDQDVEDFEVSESIWQPDAIATDNIDIADSLDNFAQVQISDLPDSFSGDFELPDLSSIVEPDDALVDEEFNFDLSNDFSSLSDSLNDQLQSEAYSIGSVDGLLSDPNDSAFSMSFDEEPTFDSNAVFTNLEENVLDLANDQEAIAGFTEGLETSAGLGEFSDPFLAEASTSINTLDLEEAAIFESMANDLVLEESLDSNYSEEFTISEPNQFNSELTESNSDISLDFPDDWLSEVADNEEVNDSFTNLPDLSIGNSSSMEEISADDSYGFANNLLDNLIDDSEDEFADLADLSVEENLPEPSTPSNFNSEILTFEDNDKAPEFNFDSFNEFDELNEEDADSIDLARAEIDDFLSGALEIEEPTKVTPKPKPEQNITLENETNSPKPNSSINA